MWIYFLLLAGAFALPAEETTDVDGDSSRKILGSSVVTSVSVIMDTGNGSKAIFSDAVGKPVSKPNTGSELASPINLLNPDRYEFYTFDDSGDLVKRLMTLDEIQGIVATGDSDGFSFDPLTASEYTPEKRVNDIVNNVQNVLKEEMEIHKDTIDTKPLFDTPDVSDSWSMILPAIFGNSGEDIKPEKPPAHVTPDTIMIEPTVQSIKSSTTTSSRPFQSSTVVNNIVYTSTRSTTPKSATPHHTTSRSTTINNQFSRITPNLFSTTPGISTTNKIVTFRPSLSSSKPEKKNGSSINVEIYSHSKSTTEKSTDHIVNTMHIIKYPDFELTKENSRPIYHVSSKPHFTKLASTTKIPLMNKISSSSTSTIATSSTRKPVSRIPPLTSTTYTYLSSSSELPKTPSSTVMTPQSYMATKIITKAPSSTTTTSTYKPKAPVKVSFTTEMPVSTEILENSLPTLAELLHMKNSDQTVFPTPATVSQKTTEMITNKPEIQTTPGITTFTIIASNKDYITTTDSKYDNTNKPTTISQLIHNLQNHASTEEDLSTLATEYVTPKINYTKSTTENTLTSVPIIYYTTAQLPTTNKNEKTPATELLDQLLLTSTNIYEINTELSQRPTIDDEDDRFDTTTNQDEVTETPTEENTSPFVINLGDPTKQPSTDKNLISSIEQLLSQAVGQIEESVANEKQNFIVQSMLNSSGKKNMSNIQTETATLASNLFENSDNDETTTSTQENILNDIASADTNLLSNSVGSLLSQVYGVDNPSLTTLDDFMSTEKYTTSNVKSTSLTHRKTENVPLTFDLKTTQKTEETTAHMPMATDKYQEIDLYEPTTTEYVTESAKNQSEAEFEPHIINITIISADKKPAKVDLSQEVEYTNEDKKNVTLIIDKNEILKTEASNSHTEKNEEMSTVKTIESTTMDITTEINDLDTRLDQTTLENIKTTTTSRIITTTNTVDATEATNPPAKEVYTTIIPNVETTTEDFTEIPVTTEITPTVIVTINESNLDEINKNKTVLSTPTANIETTTLIMDEFTSSIISTIKFTTPPTEEFTVTETFIPTTTKIQTTEEKFDSSEPNKQSWTLVPTISPHTDYDAIKKETTTHPISAIIDPPAPVDLVPKPLQGFGLEDSTSRLDTDIYQFAQLCNELAFGFWKSVTSGLSTARSVVVSPFAASSLLAMVFLGARGATSGEMNEILKLDDMVTFNPHLIFKNISESIQTSPESGVSVSAIVRELYSDRSKGQLLGFYKERVKQFYDGHVEEVSFKEIGDVIRRRTNLLVKKYSNGKIPEYLKDGSIVVRSPLAGVSVNIFQTDCSQASTDGRDGELHFVVLPSIRQRRLIPIPAVVYRSGFLAGYEPSLDATAVALGTKDQTVSTIFVIPGQQGIAAPGDGLARLEKRLVESSFKKGAWSRLLRALIPRPGLEVQIPRFSHRSVVNATRALKKMGLKDLFDPLKADLRGLNGVAHELHFSEMIQINNFATCGEERIGETHHSEIYPATPANARSARYLEFNEHSDFLEEPRDYQRAFHDPLHDPSYLSLPLPLRPRQARVPDVPRLRFDRPFLYVVRHNPTGLILHMGRFNPRLLP